MGDAMNNFNSFDFNETGYYIPKRDGTEMYIIPILFILMFIVGILGNGTLILIILRNSNMRNVPNTYIFNLAVGDMLVIITNLPAASTVYTVPNWPFGELMCKMAETAKDVSIAVSVFSLTALSGGRSVAIVDSMRTHQPRGSGSRASKKTVITIIGIWVLSILCAISTAVFSNVIRVPLTDGSEIHLCNAYPLHFGVYFMKIYFITKFFLYYATPLSIIGFFYVMMARHLFHSTRHMPGEKQGQNRQAQGRRKVAKTVLVFVIIFAVCFLPEYIYKFYVFYHWENWDEDDTFWYVFQIIAYTLSYSNSCINPIALYYISGEFRKHFNAYLFFWNKRKESDAYETEVESDEKSAVTSV